MSSSFRFYLSKIPASINFKDSFPEENLTIGFMISPEVKNSRLLLVKTQTIHGYFT